MGSRRTVGTVDALDRHAEALDAQAVLAAQAHGVGAGVEIGEEGALVVAVEGLDDGVAAVDDDGHGLDADGGAVRCAN
jgi:hypothetical protein